MRAIEKRRAKIDFLGNGIYDPSLLRLDQKDVVIAETLQEVLELKMNYGVPCALGVIGISRHYRGPLNPWVRLDQVTLL